MSHLRILFLFLVLMGAMSSCGRIVCQHDPTIHYMRIANYDTSVKYAMRVIRYDAGNNFITPLDSTENATTQTYSLNVEGNKEYKLIVLPQNRVHTISDIHFGHEKRKGSPGLSSEQCHTSIAFTLDGNTMTQPFWVEYGGEKSLDIQL